MLRTVVLITTAFPSESVTEEVFVTPELKALSREFDRVIIVPLLKYGDISAIDMPGVIVDTSIVSHIFTRFKPSKLPFLFAPYTLGKLKRIAAESDSAGQFVSKCFYCMNVTALRLLLQRIAKKYGITHDNTVFYTFWFDHATTALAEMSRRQPVTFVSRAHGHDVYDLEYGRNQVRFLRDFTLSRMRALYLVSAKGITYLDNLYPGHRDKMHLRLLGSVKPDRDRLTQCHSRKENTITILSTARVSPEKRVLLNLDFVKALAKVYPQMTVNWLHVGDGPQMETLRDKCDSHGIPENLIIRLLGAMPNVKVHELYSTETIDWTLLLSESEGTPVSVCESLSYGVPPIATAVGGVPDMISEATGVLVKHDDTAEAMVAAVMPAIDDRNRYMSMKRAARRFWEETYDSVRLRDNFARELAELLKTKKSS